MLICPLEKYFTEADLEKKLRRPPTSARLAVDFPLNTRLRGEADFPLNTRLRGEADFSPEYKTEVRRTFPLNTRLTGEADFSPEYKTDR